MKSAGLLFLVLLTLTMNTQAQTAADLAEIWDKKHISRIMPSDVRHADLKNYLEQLKKFGLKVEAVGRSGANLEIYQVEFGTGPLKVFLWSQMHGDEPTATSALIDMLAYLQKHRDKDWVKQIEQTLTIHCIPMLNPDGAEAYKRRNLQDIDINRDAINLATPEARLLKKLRDDWNPAIGFNLHNQQELTTVGNSPMQAAVSFLVVYGDAAKTTSDGHERNKRLTAAMVTALHQFIPGHIARYDDEYTATAFGDNFSAWGTPVILVETGGLYGKDEMFLVRANFFAFMTAIHSLATGSERTFDPSAYLNLPENGSGNLVNFIFRRASIVGATSTTIADIAAVTERRRSSFSASSRIATIGDLGTLHGIEEYDASGFCVYQRFGSLRPGELAEFVFYKKARAVDWSAVDVEKQFPPDAVFSGGKFVKGAGVVPKR